MEPELGLGLVKHVDHRLVEIYFPASEETRKYAAADAPLRRVVFKAGDKIKSRDGASFTIISVSAAEGIITYHGDQVDLPEKDLSDTISFTTPHDRLLNGIIDPNRDFNLRQRALEYQHRYRKAKVRGFMGGRIDLIPHQLYVAHEVTRRQIRRVLLSDETGLGKTIEACLIMHRLLVTERIGRILVLVPHSLVHQWFVELLRRFNLLFRIFDEEYCRAATETDPGANPFLDNQMGISGISFLAVNPKWRELAVAAGWDMLVIDEAHHLTEGSEAYRLAEELSAVSDSLLLLTATPEQLGHRSHFLRLQLLDPARYHDFDLFEKEEEQYQAVSSIINRFLEEDKLSPADIKRLNSLLPGELESGTDIPASDDKMDPKSRRAFIEDLLDRFGPGRVVFRNTRAAISGFPKRIAHPIPLDGKAEDLSSQSKEFSADLADTEEIPAFDFKNDPRIAWLAQFLKNNKKEKVLLICHSIQKVRAIDEALRRQLPAEIALFHEEMTLLQRDRSANWFALAEGAQILICSEIGSEGRNFQFSHHLVLFDLPPDPELLEQRIGRLDRIGQSQNIHIHIPYIQGSGYEILARWYHEGLDAFRENVPGAYQIFQQLGSAVREKALNRNLSGLEELLERTRKLRGEISGRIQKGRDRLLELNSFQPEAAKELVGEIEANDRHTDIEKFMLDVFRLYGIREDRISNHTYKLNLSLLSSAEFPLPPLKQETLTVTFDRGTALIHEDIEFLTWDHPMVMGVMDLLLGSEKGNAAAVSWPESAANEILLEVIFILESVAPKSLFADRFLPPTPIRVVVDHTLQECSNKFSREAINRAAQAFEETHILENRDLRQELIPHMLGRCEEIAGKKSQSQINRGLQSMETALDREINRLVELKKVNRNIRQEEISLLEEEKRLLREAILTARLRLDSLRLIVKGRF